MAVNFLLTDFFLQRPKDLEIARGQNLFFRCSFFQSECVLKAVGQRVTLWISPCPIGWFQTFSYEQTLFTEMYGKSDFIGKLKAVAIVQIKIPGHLNYCIDHMLRC